MKKVLFLVLGLTACGINKQDMSQPKAVTNSFFSTKDTTYYITYEDMLYSVYRFSENGGQNVGWGFSSGCSLSFAYIWCDSIRMSTGNYNGVVAPIPGSKFDRKGPYYTSASGWNSVSVLLRRTWANIYEVNDFVASNQGAKVNLQGYVRWTGKAKAGGTLQTTLKLIVCGKKVESYIPRSTYDVVSEATYIEMKNVDLSDPQCREDPYKLYPIWMEASFYGEYIQFHDMSLSWSF